jgi:serpin B
MLMGKIMRTTSFFLGALALTLAAVSGCNSDPPVDPGPGDECQDADTAGCVITSDKQRIMSPDVPAEELQALVTGNTTFGLNLYQELQAEPGNLFYSPHSISMALAMTWAGARGQTEADMAAVLGLTLTQEKTHAAFNALDQALASRGQGAQGVDGGGFRLNIANAMWAQIGFPFESPFLDTLAVNYGAGVHVVDFEKSTIQAIDLINGWVADRTEDRIEKLVNEEVVTGDTRFVLTNAIYFNAAWADPFEEKNTKDGAFNLQAGGTVTVPMMHGTQETGYVDGDGYQALSMPYDGYELSMVLVMPDAGTLADFEASLDAAAIDAIFGALGTYSVDITMPKFKFESEFNLSESLKAMGMKSAFDGADFSGMSSEGLVVTDVVHKAFVAVNEAGTEAAAATAVIGGPTSIPEPASITLDNPFLFFIRDNATGAILFVGRIQDPSK